MPGETMTGVLLFFPSYNQVYLHFWTNICMKYLVVLSFFPWIWFCILNKPIAQPAWTVCLWLCENLLMLTVSGMSKGRLQSLGRHPRCVSVTKQKRFQLPTSNWSSCSVKPFLSFRLLMWGSNSIPANSRICSGQMCQSALSFPNSHLVAQQNEKIIHAFTICHIKTFF